MDRRPQRHGGPRRPHGGRRIHLPAGERAPVADAIQDYFTNPIIGDFSVFATIGNTAWIVAMIAAGTGERGDEVSRLLVGRA